MENKKTAYTLLFTQGLSLIGSRMSGIAIGIWLFQTTGKTTYLLLIPFFNELPTLLTGHIAGVLIDRYKRKTSLILGDAGQAIGSVLLLIAIAGDVFKPWMLFVIVLLQGFFSMIQAASSDASMTLLIHEDIRERFNAIKEMLFPAAGVIAPMLTALIYPFFGIIGVIIFDLITFLLAVIILKGLDIPDPKGDWFTEDRADSWREDLKTGYRFIKKNRLLLWLIIYFSFLNFMLNGPLELVIPYILELTKSEVLVSVMLSVMSAGTFIGAMIIVILGKVDHKVNFILGSMILTGSMMIVFGIMRTPWTLGVSLFLLMMPLPVIGALFKSILQRKVPPHLQGRVFSTSYQIAYGIAPLSFLLVGPLVDRVLEPSMQKGEWDYLSDIFGQMAGSGMGVALSFTGLIILTGTIAMSLNRDFRHLETTLSEHKDL